MKRERWTWIGVYVLGNLIGMFAERLVDVVGEARTAGLFGLTGVALGLCWYRLYPRPLIERIRPAAVVILAFSVLTLSFGGEISHPTVRSMIGVGVLAGLIIGETWRPGQEWARQRRTQLTSPDTMRGLR